MRQRTKAGTSKRHGGASKGGKQRRFRFARRVEELAASLGIMLTRQKAGRKRPLRMARGGKSRTRSVSADTRRWRAAKTTVKKGRKIGLGRKRVRPG
jgi:hypothetical protein